ncbi:MAG TPA: hypothetical protein VFS39_05595 [Nitrospira sp.]|nr:hypothetical protein [Nitrospira sp.]
MSRIISVLAVPESLWVLICLCVSTAAAWNSPSTPAGNAFLETLWVAVPLVGIPVTFVTASLRGSLTWWWLLRAVAASCVGVMIAGFLAASGVDYHDSRNSGLLAAPLYSLAIGIFVLAPGIVIAAIVLLRRRGRSPHVA